MTKLNACESALFLTQLARGELRSEMTDLRAQLADLRLKGAEAALKGTVDMTEYERKILGKSAQGG